eukprot:4469576-Amphidinium_carterae.1
MLAHSLAAPPLHIRLVPFTPGVLPFLSLPPSTSGYPIRLHCALYHLPFTFLPSPHTTSFSGSKHA